MATPLLNSLPREIRDQIWTYVLSSPTGFLSLNLISNNVPCPRRVRPTLSIIPYSPTTHELHPEQKIKLSFLRTCKQINRECATLLFRLNALRVERAWDFAYFLSYPTLGKLLRENLQDLEMDILDTSILDQKSVNIYAAAEQLAAWPLRSLTLTFRQVMTGPFRQATRRISAGIGRGEVEYEPPMGDFRCLRLCTRYMQLLRQVAPETEKKMILYTGLLTKGPQVKADWLRLNVPNDPNGVAQDLHAAFGGEMWVDGVLAYKDGVALEDMFELRPHEEEAMAVWSF